MRRFFSRSKTRTVPILIGINLLVFMAWHSVKTEAGFQFMAEHFLVSWTGLMQGHYETLITSVFSHNMFWHFLINMLVLASFGPPMEMTLGTRRFLIFYFAAGIFSSFSHSFLSAFLLKAPHLQALGASGALSGMVLLFSLLYPKERILIFGLIPVPALWGALFFVGLDLWGLSAQAEGGGLPIGHGAHLGGAFVGFVYYLYLRQKKRKFERLRQQVPL